MIQDKSFGLLSPEQTTAILDNAPVAVYVSALETYELLYANGRAKKILLTVDGKPGDTCYQAVGLDRPCPFCRVSSMNRSELTTRKFRHPGNQRVYQLSGMLIDWNGRAAHIEYIMDITEAQKEDDRNKALKEELVATFSSIPSGLCVYRYENGRITPIFHNPAFYIIMGYSEKHVKAVEENTNFLGVHPEDLTPLQAKIRKAIQTDGIVQDTYRVWSDAKQEYRWIQLDGSVKSQEDGTKLLYGVYSDVNERRRLERELTDANNKMQDIINAIPGGVAIYKIAAEFEVVYLSDGVSELSGYTPMEYRKLLNENEAELTYGEDVPLVAAKVREAIQNRGVSTYEYRQLHRDGRLVWVRAQVKWIGEADGGSLLHCVFHNITEQKEAQLEMEHMLNSIPGGIASYREWN